MGRGASLSAKKSLFSKNEKGAVEWYVSGEGMYINEVLRNIIPKDKGDDSFIKDLDSATKKKFVKENKLYRAIDSSVVFGNMSSLMNENMVSRYVYNMPAKGAYMKNEYAKMDKVISRAMGRQFTEKGFMSTTTSKSLATDWHGFTGAKNDIVLEMNVPKKSVKGTSVSSVSKSLENRMGQKEVILERGTRYVPKKIKSANGTIVVEVDVLKRR